MTSKVQSKEEKAEFLYFLMGHSTNSCQIIPFSCDALLRPCSCFMGSATSTILVFEIHNPCSYFTTTNLGHTHTSWKYLYTWNHSSFQSYHLPYVSDGWCDLPWSWLVSEWRNPGPQLTNKTLIGARAALTPAPKDQKIVSAPRFRTPLPPKLIQPNSLAAARTSSNAEWSLPKDI